MPLYIAARQTGAIDGQTKERGVLTYLLAEMLHCDLRRNGRTVELSTQKDKFDQQRRTERPGRMYHLIGLTNRLDDNILKEECQALV